MFDFFKKKQDTADTRNDLEKARDFGFITEEELLILKIYRAEKELKNLGFEPKKRSHHRQ